MKLQRIGIIAVSAALLLIQNASAQVLFTTTNDFGQFDSGTGVVSTAYYGDSSAVNGIGNTVDAGGAGTVGSLQITASSGFIFFVSGDTWPGATAALFQSLDPGGSRPYSPESGFGPGTMLSHSGTLALDVYRGDLTDYYQPGFIFNYDSHFDAFFSTSETDFTGADGRTWTHYEVPYTLGATTLNYFQVGLAQNAGAIAGEIYYVDNIQVVPEPSTLALLGMGLLSLFCVIRRRVS